MKLKLNTKIKHLGKTYKVVKGNDCYECDLWQKDTKINCKDIECKSYKILKEVK